MWCDPPDSRSAGLPPAGPLSGGQLAPIVGGHHHNPLEHHADLKFSISPKISILGLNSGWHPFPVLALFAFSGAEMINLDLCSWLLLSCRFGWSWPLTGTAVRKEVEQKCLQWPGKHLATPCNTLQHLATLWITCALQAVKMKGDVQICSYEVECRHCIALQGRARERWTGIMNLGLRLISSLHTPATCRLNNDDVCCVTIFIEMTNIWYGWHMDDDLIDHLNDIDDDFFGHLNEGKSLIRIAPLTAPVFLALPPFCSSA